MTAKRVWICAGLLTAVCIALYLLWAAGGLLPRWIDWKDRTLPAASGRYEIQLRHKGVTVLYENAPVWHSPEHVLVQDVLSIDIDDDSAQELILLCWKRGRYGRLRPFWVEEDEQGWSQHIFVYEYDDKTLRPKWMSSYIGEDVAHMAAGERAAAPSYRLLLTSPDGTLSCWVWDSWGFSREDTDVTFTVFGDNLIHEPIYRYGLRNDGDFGFLFENFRDILSQSDVSIINQETPLTDNPLLYSGYPRFATPVGVGQAIVDAGFDVVTCATNHALDAGEYGLGFTKEFFDSHDVRCLGIGTGEAQDDCPYGLLTRSGIRFALLNYTYGTNGLTLPEDARCTVNLLSDADRVRADLAAARAGADFVIVFVHWGTEYAAQPDDFQREWAQVFLEGKADVVVGTHPHALQPYEVLTDDDGHEMLIYYSIGNFVSAQNEPSCIKGGMARFTVSLTPNGYSVTQYSLQPLEITAQGGGKYITDLVR
ncbi:MAG: CapA family protein [Roseburia sp.]|nr:CapA family protein [Roseburia sp.]